MAGKIKKFFKYTGLTFAVVLVLAGSFAAHEWYAKPFYINNFFNRAFIQFIWDKPEALTSMGMLEQLGINGHNAEWNDDSEAAADRDFAFLTEIMDTLAEYDENKLTEDEKLSVKVLRELLGNPEEDRKYRYHNYPVNQLFGLQNAIPRFLDTFHRVNTREDAEHYISRLSKIGLKMDQNMEGLLIREERGIIPPTFVIDKSVDIMQEFVAQPAEENVLYVSFKEKLDGAEEIGDPDRQALLESAKTEIENVVYPAYRGYVDYFTALRAKSNNDAGVWKLPDGKAFYNYALHRNTTTDMTADEIHAIGLAEVERIQAEMLDIFAAEGYDPALGVKALFDQLATEQRFYYPDTDEGRAQILEDYATIIDEIEAGIAAAFNIRPKADIVVKRVPEFSQETAPGAYYNGPSRDGSRPGTFYANLFDIKATPKYGMRTLAYHEGVPGHHFQIAIQSELEGIPEFRKESRFTSYTEGWGLYAERLAWEMGFQADPYDNLGRLQGELFRAVRLVVDTGIHAKRWTREEAIDYMLANTGTTESDVVAEIERYIVNPGQATAYKVGMMELLRLREETQQALGDKFDIRDFHDVVLKSGALPLTALRELVMKYIEETQAA
ncbi:MAG: DUF885 domain-containing protein [Gammaproteobacteria bacterium]|nr:DUF885 domain-containing protein [Gammaproteobacteria bacterium]MDH3373755.1 DUF885 domain-containing protein [Gammaproteobacteria bacterium]MDH3408813.1 DUF885 domain-containing protein [Gammaproteobacteria bacterium]MDH3552711.1 DUF885 domain-containing protein [Gammaproteobacteria bacterium]